jgi:high affinity Mn2+ porin
MSAGAYDYAADSRGYSWGAALEWYHDDWAVRGGRFIQPKQPNQLALDPHIFTHYGDQIEVEHSHTLHGQPGKLRLLAFRNRTRMSRFQDALDYAAQHGGTPDINAVRNGDQIKYGFGLNLEQQVSANIGVFARANWADGKTETYAFTEIDNSVAAGGVLQGSLWGRAQDSIGMPMCKTGFPASTAPIWWQAGWGFLSAMARSTTARSGFWKAITVWG